LAPVANGVPVTGYVVTPYRVSPYLPPFPLPSTRFTATSGRVTGLSNEVSYLFRVEAVSGPATGPATQPTAAIAVGGPPDR
ncbi:fibronectin type III domain-containing protein, partial [Salmonella enterica subsp. enterica serovar Typhimurium]